MIVTHPLQALAVAVWVIAATHAGSTEATYDGASVREGGGAVPDCRDLDASLVDGPTHCRLGPGHYGLLYPPPIGIEDQIDERSAKIRLACAKETASDIRAALLEGIQELLDFGEAQRGRRLTTRSSLVLGEAVDTLIELPYAWHLSVPLEQGGYGHSMEEEFERIYVPMFYGSGGGFQGIDGEDTPQWARDVSVGLKCFDRANAGGNVCSDPTLAWRQLREEFQEELVARGVADVASLRSHCRMREAVVEGDVDVVTALVGQGIDLNVALPSVEAPLLEAVRAGALDTAGVLVESGASPDLADVTGWTPLHHILAGPWQAGPVEAQRSALALRLLERSELADAATKVVGWTPLHLAAAVGDRVVVEALLAKGADPNAASRVGGWTPAFLAEREGHEAVAAALQAAGGIARAGGDSQPFPLHLFGRGGPEDWMFDEEPRHAVPDHGAGGSGAHVAGNFTRSGSPERLVFEGVGLESESGRRLVAAGLLGADGDTQVLWVGDSYRQFLRLCRDPETGLDHVMMMQGHGGSSRGLEMEAWHADPASRALSLAYSFECTCDEPRALAESIAWPDEDGRCQWRRRQAAEEAIARILPELRVGETLPVAYDGTMELALPNRDIPAETVEAALAVLRTLPEEIATTEVLEAGAPSGSEGTSASGRWEVVSVARSGRGADGYHETDGALLVRDTRSGEWRSIYDCGNVVVEGSRGDMLLVSVPARYDIGESDRGPCSPGLRRTVQIDLATLLVR